MSPERTVYSKIKPSSLLLLTPMLMESRVNNAEYAGIYFKKQNKQCFTSCALKFVDSLTMYSWRCELHLYICKQVYFKGGGSTQAVFPRRKKTEASADGLCLFCVESACSSRVVIVVFCGAASFLPHSKNMPKQIIDTSASNLLFNKRWWLRPNPNYPPCPYNLALPLRFVRGCRG